MIVIFGVYVLLIQWEGHLRLNAEAVAGDWSV